MKHDLEDTRPFPGECRPYHGTEELSRSRSSVADGGLLQSIENGVVLGNRNADNVDALFQQLSLLMSLSRSIQTDDISAGVMIRSHLLYSDIEVIDACYSHHSVLARLAERFLFVHAMCLPRHHPLCTGHTKYSTMSAISNRTKLCRR